jgi:hypothetical protein
MSCNATTTVGEPIYHDLDEVTGANWGVSAT